MKYLIPFALFIFQLALMYLIWDKYPAPCLRNSFLKQRLGWSDSEGSC